MIDEQAQRAVMISEAQSYLRTPYAHMGRIKGAGVDCATLILECAIRAGIVPASEAQLSYYAFQWNLNQSTERLIDFIIRYAPEIPAQGGPGSICVWQMGRTFSHGAIVIDWPRCIHARVMSGCEWVDAEADSVLKWIATGKPRPKRFFSPWPSR